MLAYDVKRALNIRWFIMSAGAMLVPLFSVLDVAVKAVRDKQLLEYGWTLEFLQKMLTNEVVLFVLPVICTLPFASSFTEEFRQGAVRYSLVRVHRKKFIRSKYLTAMLSGGLAAVIGALVICILVSIVFMPAEQPPVREVQAELAGSLKEVQEISREILIIRILCRYFCLGALGAVTGLCFSTIFNNRYMAWFSPFMAEYLLIILCERYFENCIVLNPKEWLKPSEGWPLDTWSVCLWLASLTLFASWAFAVTARRRMKGW